MCQCDVKGCQLIVAVRSPLVVSAVCLDVQHQQTQIPNQLTHPASPLCASAYTASSTGLSD